MARPLTKAYNGLTGADAASIPLPGVFLAPIRRDIVHFVHLNMAKNKCVLRSKGVGWGWGGFFCWLCCVCVLARTLCHVPPFPLASRV